MLRSLTLPGTLSRVLAGFRPCFTAPTFTTFTALVAGLLAQPVGRTVCGMLSGAGLERIWHHSRAHRFFSTARWRPDQVGLLLAELIVTYLLTPGAPITLAVDDTLFRRRGKKVHGVGWFHDGSAAGQTKLGRGNNWVVVTIIVTLPFLSRPVALPVLARLAVKNGRSKPDLARDLVDLIAERFADRDVHLVADAAYGCSAFAGLGDGMSMTTRARANAVFSHLAPPRTGKRGRPHLKGDRIGTPTQIATTATWRAAVVSRYGTTSTVAVAEQICLWYGTWRTDTVRVILVREQGSTKTQGYDIALITTDLLATPEVVIAATRPVGLSRSRSSRSRTFLESDRPATGSGRRSSVPSRSDCSATVS
jgi:DDE superfamily endonuclease